jgi:disulfide bond formation protein DsbB
MSFVLNLFDNTPRRVFWLLFGVCLGLLGFALYLQHVGGLEPCPMCIVQREIFIAVGLVAAVCGLLKGRMAHIAGGGLLAVLAILGAIVAGRQSWLQWNPPAVASCGRDLYGMIENFPLSRVIPMVFKGSGDCSKVDWTFLTLSIANWSFICFCCVFVVAVLMVLRRKQAAR